MNCRLRTYDKYATSSSEKYTKEQIHITLGSFAEMTGSSLRQLAKLIDSLLTCVSCLRLISNFGTVMKAIIRQSGVLHCAAGSTCKSSFSHSTVPLERSNKGPVALQSLMHHLASCRKATSCSWGQTTHVLHSCWRVTEVGRHWCGRNASSACCW